MLLSLLCIAASAVAGVFMAATPLLNVIGYESGAAAAIFISVVACILGVAAGRATRTADDAAAAPAVLSVNRAYMLSLAAGFASLASLASIIAAKTFFFDKCNIGTGFPIFAWIAVPTLIHTTAVGVFLGRRCSKRWTATLLFAAYFLLSAVATLMEFLLGQHQVVNNLIIGAFTMTGFNGWALVVPDSFYVYRILIMFFSVFFIGLAILARPGGGELSKTDHFIGWRNVVVPLVVFVACVVFVPDQTGFGSGRRTLDAELSETIDTGNAVIHFSPGAMTRDERRRAAAYTEWWLLRIRDALDMEQPWKVQIYLYRDSDQMERHTCARDFYFAQPWKQTLHIEKRSVGTEIMKHELTHVMMGAFGSGIFGTPYNMGAVEGIAVAVEEDLFRGADSQEKYAAALQAHVIAPGTQTISNAGFGATTMWKSYDMAGGFVGFLLYRYGPEKYEKYYAHTDAQKAYGKTLGGLNKEWYDWLAGIEVRPYVLKYVAHKYDDTAFPAFYKTRCPRVGSREKEEESPYRKVGALREEKKYDEAAALCGAYYAKNNDPEWLVRKARAHREAGEYQKMAAAARQASNAEKIQPGTKGRAYLLEAWAYAKLGDFAAAADALEALSEYGVYEPEYTEIALRIARRKGTNRILLCAYLHRAYSDAAYGKLLETAAALDPDFGIIYQQAAASIGKDTFRNIDGYLERFSELTEKFLKLSPGLNETKYDLLQRLGTAYLDARRYDEAVSTFNRMTGFAASGKDVYQARELAARAAFVGAYNSVEPRAETSPGGVEIDSP